MYSLLIASGAAAMGRGIFRGLLVLLWLALFAPQVIAAPKRVALVIGNSAYQHAPALSNPRNDATDFAVALRAFGFKVVEAHDLDKAGMDRAILEFARSLTGADAGLFFYAGHGLQVGAVNYLVPVDAKLSEASGLDFETVRLDLVQKTMERETQTSILFLDACRNNPLARNLARAMGTRSPQVGRGLATVEAGVGTLVSFSTQPGNVAEDGTGRNSPFAGALLRQLGGPREDLSTLLIGVRNDVITATKRAQVPWEHSALTAKFYFPQAVAVVPEAVKPQGPTHAQQEELAFWNTAKDMNEAAGIEMYLAQYPNGRFAGLALVLLSKLQREAQQKVALAKSEADTKLRDEAKQADTLKKAEDDAKAKAAAEREREAAQKAAEAKIALAAAQAERAAAAKPVPSPAATPAPELQVRKIQDELTRLGCNPGALDGKWGANARGALERFAKLAKVNVDLDQPDSAVLDALLKQKSRICPLVCDDDEEVKSGTCVTKAVPKSNPVSAKAAPSKPTTTSATAQPIDNPALASRFRLCGSYNGWVVGARCRSQGKECTITRLVNPGSSGVATKADWQC